jgi:hypothetical protein
VELAPVASAPVSTAWSVTSSDIGRLSCHPFTDAPSPPAAAPPV